MIRQDAQELLPIIKAFAEGKIIEVFDDDRWVEIFDPSFSLSPKYYRVKPEPKYRPFKTHEECWNEMLKHQPFGWIKSKDNAEVVQIGRLVKAGGCGCLITLSIDEGHNIAPSYYYNNYTFTDGTPFGVEEE